MQAVTVAERKALGKYVRWVADVIGLRDWAFNVRHARPEGIAEDSLACCQPTYGRRHALLWFGDDILEEDSLGQRQTVIHELLHCHFAATQEQVRLDLLKHLGQATYDVFVAAWRMNHEYALDAVSYALAKQMPEIAWPKKRP